MPTFTHQQVKRFKPLPVGTLSSGREVLEILRAGDTRSALYRVRYTCCGHVSELGHVALRQGVRRDQENPNAAPIPCRSCSAVQASERNRAPKPKRPPAAAGARDLNGHFWPALGKIRQDASKKAASRRGMPT